MKEWVRLAQQNTLDSRRRLSLDTGSHRWLQPRRARGAHKWL